MQIRKDPTYSAMSILQYVVIASFLPYFCSMQKITQSISLLLLIFALAYSFPTTSQAQCAMCSLTAQNATENGNNQGKGLNNGILFLLGMPFILGGVVGVVWYTKFRRKDNVKVKDKPILLN